MRALERLDVQISDRKHYRMLLLIVESGAMYCVILVRIRYDQLSYLLESFNLFSSLLSSSSLSLKRTMLLPLSLSYTSPNI